MNVGARIYTQIPRPRRELVEGFRGLPVANVCDNMNRIFCVDSAICSMNKRSLLGTALTIHAPSGDNLLLHKALDMAQPGDVIVLAGGGYERSFTGELMMRCAQNLGLAGVVIDGCIRDAEEIATLDMPVFAKGVTPQGPYKHGPGEINVPVAFGGQVVFPGDIVIGDTDGIVFVRPDEAEEICNKTKAQFDKEEALRQRYINGEQCPSYSPQAREATLAQLGFEVIQSSWK